jgi:hypothetical protein
VSVQIDFPKKTYARCDTIGCDNYGLASEASGIFTIINIPGGGAFFKVVNDGSEYVEVASLHLAVQQTFGTCQPIK